MTFESFKGALLTSCRKELVHRPTRARSPFSRNIKTTTRMRDYSEEHHIYHVRESILPDINLMDYIREKKEKAKKKKYKIKK